MHFIYGQVTFKRLRLTRMLGQTSNSFSEEFLLASIYNSWREINGDKLWTENQDCSQFASILIDILYMFFVAPYYYFIKF